MTIVNNEITSVELMDGFVVEGNSTEDLINELQYIYFEYKGRVEEIIEILADEPTNGVEFTERLTGEDWNLGLSDGYEFTADSREDLVDYLSFFREDWMKRYESAEYEMEELVSSEETKELLELS